MKLRTVFFGIAAFTGAGLLLLIAAWAVWLNVEKGKVRAIQEEMRAEGLPMVAADLEPPPLADEDNAALLLERAAELLKELKKREGWIEAWSGTGTKTGTDPVAFDEAKRRSFRDQMSWSETQEALRLLREAAAKPGAFFNDNVSQGPYMSIGPRAEFLSAARLLCASAWLSASQGQTHDAARDLIVSLRLGSFAQVSPVLIDWHLARAISELTVDAAASIANISPPSVFGSPLWIGVSEQWRDRAERLRPSLIDALDRERISFAPWVFGESPRDGGTMLDLMADTLGRPGLKRSTALFLAGYTHPRNPMLAADHAAYLTHVRKLRKAAGSLPVGDDAIATRKSEVPKSALLTRLTGPALETAVSRSDQAAVQLQIGQLGLALEQWRAEHGRYPKTLAELGLPAEETTDVYRGKPLFYRVEGDGVVLYSGGTNRKDDGGTTEKRSDLVWQVQRGSVSSAGR